jgi:hypothetical protein
MGVWRALEMAASKDPRLDDYDFPRLASRMESQHETIEQQGLSFAPSALVNY